MDTPKPAPPKFDWESEALHLAVNRTTIPPHVDNPFIGCWVGEGFSTNIWLSSLEAPDLNQFLNIFDQLLKCQAISMEIYVFNDIHNRPIAYYTDYFGWEIGSYVSGDTVDVQDRFKEMIKSKVVL